MIDTVIATALQEAILRLPASAIGIKSHAIPTEEYLTECVAAARLILDGPRFSGCRFVIGSSRLTANQAHGLIVLPPDAAAAEATRLRNDRAAVAAPGFLLVYLNSESTPGEGGLDVLSELGAQAIARLFAERSGLPVLAGVAKSKARRLVHRLEDSSVDMLAGYAMTAQEHGSESYALPLLGLLPRDHANPQPSVSWATDFDALSGDKLTGRLGEALEALEALGPSERKAVEKQLERLVPAKFRGDPLRFVIPLCRATIRFAGGHIEELPSICGLSASLLRFLRKGPALAGDVGDSRDASENGVGDSTERATRRPPLEEEILRDRGVGALQHTPSHLDDDGRVLSVIADDGATPLQLRSREGAKLVGRLLGTLSPKFWLEGAAVQVNQVEPILTPVVPSDTTFEPCSELGDGRRACEATLQKKIEAFTDRRGALIRKLSEPTLIDLDTFMDDGAGGESAAPDRDLRLEIQGIFLLEAFPLTAVTQARAEADAYVVAYRELVSEAFNGGTPAPESVGAWLTNLDVAFYAQKGMVVAARLLPTHPLRIAHSTLWLDSQRRPPAFPASLAVQFRRADSLAPHGRDFSFHNTQTVGPGTDGLMTAAREGFRGLWNLIAPRGLARALDIELVDVSDPVEVIETLCAEALDRFEEDTSVGAGVHLRVACAYSEPSRDLELVVPGAEDLLSLSSELLGARPGAGVTLELDRNIRKAGSSPVHLAIQAVDTPYVRLPVDHGLVDLYQTDVSYVPGPGGNISLIKVIGNGALDAYQKLLEQRQVPPWLGFGPVEQSARVGSTLVRTLVSREGWPLKLPLDESFLSYTEDGQHIVVSLCDPEVLTRLVKQKLAALSERIEGDAIGDLDGLRKGIRAMYSCRSFISRLLADADPRHLLGDLGLLRAFSAAQQANGGRELLLISLDGPDGRNWARTVAALIDGPETRADLLILEATPELDRIVRIRVAELKARSSAAELNSPSALRVLARQAQVTAARVRACFAEPDESRRHVHVGALRRLIWMGAGHQLRALQWKRALDSLDRRLSDRDAIEVSAECWIVPEEEWTGEASFEASFPALSEIGAETTGSERLRFRVLARQTVKAAPIATGGAVSPRERSKPRQAPPPITPSPGPVRTGVDGASANDEAIPAIPAQVARPVVALRSPSSSASPVSIPADELEIPLGVHLATGKTETWRPYATNPRLSNQHILVVGKSGSGKSETTKALIWELNQRSVPSIIFDYQGEYGDAGKDFFKVVRPQVFDVMQGLPINPFEVPIDPRTGARRSFIEVVFRLADTLNRVFRGSGDIQLGVLREAIRLCYLEKGFVLDKPDTWAREPPTMDLLRSKLDELAAARGSQVKNLQVRLQPLFESGIFQPGRAGFRFDELFKQTTVILMTSGITDLMLAASRLMLEGIYSRMLTLGESPTIRVMACVDEAHKLCGDETVTTLIKEARKYGLGLILSSQETRDFHPSVFANVGTIVCLQLEEADAAVMAKQIAGQDPPRQKQLKQTIMGEAFPEGVVKSNHFQPFIPLRLTPFHERARPQTAAPRGEAFLGYEIVKALSGGGMAEVFQARDPATGTFVCVKRVRASSLDAEALQREAQIYQKLQAIDCPNLLRVHSFDREGDYMALVTDFADGGDLAAYVRTERVRPAKAKQIALQIGEALRALHGASIVHRDLKPENVLLTGDQWQVADFGIAKNLTRLMTMKTFQLFGTLGYMAPEQMDGSEAHPSADIYSFAKILVFLLTGGTDKDYVTQAAWRPLIARCLVHESDKRPTIEQVIHELNQILA